MMRLKTFLLSVLGWIALAAAPALADDIQKLEVISGEYVIDSDADNNDSGYDRDEIAASVEVEHDHPGGDDEQSYRYSFRLLDSDGDAQPIVTESGTATELEFDVDLEFSSDTEPGGGTAYLKPALRLDPFDEYRVELTVRHLDDDQEPVTASDESDSQRLFHFTKTDSDDGSLDVIAMLDDAGSGDGPGYTRTWMVDTAPGQEAVEVEVNAEFLRYDPYPVSDDVDYRLDYVLRRDSDGDEVPLEKDSREFDVTVPASTGSSPSEPVRVSEGPLSLDIEPADGINLPHDETYTLEVTIVHVEDPESDQERTGNTVEADPQDFLHFNGTVRFGEDDRLVEAVVTELNGDPSRQGSEGDSVRTNLDLASDGAQIDESPNLTLGPTSLDVLLDPQGTATLRSGSVDVNISAGGAWGDANGVSFRRESITLDIDGASGDVRLRLPPGSGLLAERSGTMATREDLEGSAVFGQEMAPLDDISVSDPVSYSPKEWFYTEGLPFAFRFTSVNWLVEAGEIRFEVSPGNEHHRTEAMHAYLEKVRADGVLADPEAARKASNRAYYRYAAVAEQRISLRPGAGGVARATANFSISGGTMEAHFPSEAEINWADGMIALRNGIVNTEDSRLDGAGVSIPYLRNCLSGGNCGGEDEQLHQFLPDGATLGFTHDGGLTGAGDVDGGAELAWGRIESDLYAHRTSRFDEGAFHMPGHFLQVEELREVGGEQPYHPDRGAGVVLLSGVDAENPSQPERPETQAFAAGLGDYPGLNFRVESSGFKAFSTIAGTSEDDEHEFTATTRSKYYFRKGGVFGIHEAEPGTFPSDLTIYGYDFTFTNYGLNFLQSENIESRTNGDVTVPFPSDFTQEFEELTLTCLGALDDAQVPEDGAENSLVYWAADFVTRAIQFEPEESDGADECDPSSAFLTLGIMTEPGSFGAPLFGKLGFKADGNLLTAADEQSTDSRLPLPSDATVAGPGEEEYSLNAVSHVYFNNYDERPSSGSASDTPGFLSVAAEMDVPFFEALQVQIHSGASERESTPVHVMGGWPDRGWRDGDDHFFSNAGFDGAHRGYPEQSGANVDAYRNTEGSENEEYLVRARQEWLGVVPFDYPLVWSSVNRAFRSSRNVENDLLVIDIEHHVEYLSAENAELIFGAEFEGGLPQLNLTSMTYDSLDDSLGFSQTITEEMSDFAFDAVDGGIDGLAGILDDQLDEFFETVFDETIDPTIDTLEERIRDRVEEIEEQAPSQAEYENKISDLEDDFINGEEEFEDLRDTLLTGVKDVTGLVDQIDARLEEAELAIALLRDKEIDTSQISDEVIERIGYEVDNLKDELPGLLFKDGDKRRIVQALVEAVAGDELGDVVGSAIEEPLNDLLEKADPTLGQIDTVLGEIEEVIAGVREQLEPGKEFFDDLDARLTQLDSEIDQVVDGSTDEIFDFLEELPEQDAKIADFDAEELKQRIRQEFEDRFFSSEVITEVQVAIKQRVYDVNTQVRSAIDTAFARVNEVGRELIASTLGEAEEEINGFLGDIGESIGRGQIEGYAHINGDALRLLRLDGDLELRLEDDPIRFDGYLQIEQLNSESDSGGCELEEGDSVTEVSFGVVDAPLDWISPDLRATIEADFSFESEGEVPAPLGFGGSFEVLGTISFEEFEINELKASLAASRDPSGGIREAYLSAAVGMKFSSYEGFGGVFFGRTCSLDPIASWDEDVAGVLGDPPFTGGYVYAEAWVPILGQGCVFNVTVGAGVGVFYFVEGPTYGGKMLGGVSGEALCVVSVRGEIEMIGVKQADDFVFSGEGTVKGKAGKCPFCIKVNKTVGASYEAGSWDIDI